MEGYVSEQDQIEAVKKWWKENAKSLLVGVALGAILVIGVKMWLSYVQAHAERGSDAYEQLLADLDRKQIDAVLDRGKRMVEEYSDTPYGPLAALVLAKEKSDRGDLAAAAADLRSALDKARQPALQHVARLRLGRILLAQGDAAGAAKLLENVDAEEFAASYAELKGDIHLAMSKAEAARAEYAKALASLKEGTPSEELQMKLDDLGGADKR